MVTVETSSESQALLLHQSTTTGITWRVLLRPELRRSGESQVVKFVKLGRKSKLLDQVIGWGGGSHRTQQAGRPGQHRVQGLTGEGSTWLGISWDGLSVCWYGSGYGVWVLRTLPLSGRQGA